ncbi:MAG: signal peptidase I [Bacilli bacterium]
MKKIFKIISWTLSAILIVMAVFILVFGTISIKNNKPMKVFGYSYAVVVTESMTGTINKGDIVVINDYPYEDIIKDDIICFYNPNINGMTVTHRVTEVTEDGFKTKGDYNPDADTWTITEDEYIGKIVNYGSCLGIGKLIMNGRIFLFIVLIAIFGYIGISETINIVKIVNKKHKDELEQEAEENMLKKKMQIKKELLKEIKEEEKNKL